MKIGIFDSGLGGLSVFKQIAEILPQYDLVYLGDNARAPYGDRSQETILKFTREAVEHLFKQHDCQVIVLACNTVSAKALRKLQQEYLPVNFPNRRILGVIRPIIEEVARLNSSKVGVLATRSTVDSGAYQRELANICPSTKIVLQAAPLLVPLIEEGWGGHEYTKLILKEYLKPLLSENLDILVPACTHYSLIEKQLIELVGPNIAVLDTPKLVAQSLKDYLTTHCDIESALGRSGERSYLVTDLSTQYDIFSQELFGKKVDFQKVELA
jgi:glutamate racemase